MDMHPKSTPSDCMGLMLYELRNRHALLPSTSVYLQQQVHGSNTADGAKQQQTSWPWANSSSAAAQVKSSQPAFVNINADVILHLSQCMLLSSQLASRILAGWISLLNHLESVAGTQADLGCIWGRGWPGVGVCVRRRREQSKEQHQRLLSQAAVGFIAKYDTRCSPAVMPSRGRRWGIPRYVGSMGYLLNSTFFSPSKSFLHHVACRSNITGLE